MEEVKLLGTWSSAFVLRAKMALGLKGVKYEFLEEVEMMPVKSELLLKSNTVYKKVPVLIHAGKPVCESMIIVQYIDEAWAGVGPAIMPAHPYDRAMARFWAVYIDDKLFPAIRSISFEQTEEVKAMDELQLLEEAFRECSKGKDFFGGDNIGYVDIAFGSCLGFAKAAEKLTNIKVLDESKTPLLVGWAERFLSNGVVKGLMPEVDRLADYLVRKRQAVLRDAAAAKAASSQ